MAAPIISRAYVPFVMTAGQSLLVKQGNGVVGAFIPTTSGTMIIYDNTSAVAPIILNSMAVTAGVPVPLDMIFQTGLFIALTSAAGTVLYY